MKCPRLLFAGAMLVLALATIARAAAPSATPDAIHLSWQHDPTTTMTVLWRTNESVQESVVEYGTDSSLGQTATGTFQNYGDRGARIHTVEITGLAPDTLYYYRCGSSKGMSPVYTFATAPGDACARLRFVVLGDSRATAGDGTSPVWRDVIEAAVREDPDFVVMNGDLVKEGDVEEGWDQFFELGSPALAETPLLPVWGNHDDRDGSLFPILFAVPAGPEGTDYYPLDVGVLHLAVLDSEHGALRYQAQAAWLDEDLPFHEGKWRMAICHRPAYSSGTTHGSDEEVQQYLLPVFERHRLDVFFGSHDHIYERTCAIKAGACVADPAEGTVYFVTGGAGAFMNPIGGLAWFTQKFTAQYHYILVEIGFDRIDIEARDRAGATIDQLGWNRGAPVAPVAAIDAAPQEVAVGEAVHFDGTRSSSCGGTITAYAWDLGNGERRAEPAFDYAYPEAGTFHVVLTVTDDEGMTAQAAVDIVVNAPADDDTGDDTGPDDDTTPDDDSGADDDAGDDDGGGCGC